MTKNPLLNALAALAYIILVAAIISSLSKYAPKEDGFLAPVAALSMFTLSAAVMGYIFVFQPLRLYLDGNKQEAITLFLRTVGAFAVITILILIILVSGIWPQS